MSSRQSRMEVDSSRDRIYFKRRKLLTALEKMGV